MNEAVNQWRQIRDEYLRQIENELTTVHSPNKKELLADVRRHLEQKFEALPESDRTQEAYHTIIADMGPAEEYAELLAESTPKTNGRPPVPSDRLALINLLLTLLFAAVFIGVIVYRFTEDRFMDPGGNAETHSKIRITDDEQYLFFERISGDATIRGMKPEYDVLKKGC